MRNNNIKRIFDKIIKLKYINDLELIYNDYLFKFNKISDNYIHIEEFELSNNKNEILTSSNDLYYSLINNQLTGNSVSIYIDVFKNFETEINKILLEQKIYSQIEIVDNSRKLNKI